MCFAYAENEDNVVKIRMAVVVRDVSVSIAFCPKDRVTKKEEGRFYPSHPNTREYAQSIN